MFSNNLNIFSRFYILNASTVLTKLFMLLIQMPPVSRPNKSPLNHVQMNSRTSWFRALKNPNILITLPFRNEKEYKTHEFSIWCKNII